MIQSKLFGKTFSIFSKALDLRSMRHHIISTNIANVSTPNYRAMDLEFDKALKSQIGLQRTLTLSNTNRSHIASSSTQWKGMENYVVQEESAVAGSDGNTVDEEREMVKLAENQLAYQSLVQVISRKLLSIKSAIQEGGK